MAGRTIMIQGTGSYVGKGVVTAALCRHFREEGHRVAPFKRRTCPTTRLSPPKGPGTGVPSSGLRY